eukprot:m.209541 g.209541  ORF g.209541 m.209541 type:complete len:507 (+) comp25467_c0_seq1:310-1830(+)
MSSATLAVLAAIAGSAIAAPALVRSASVSLPYTVFVSNKAEARPSPYSFDVSSVEMVANMASAVVYGPLAFDESFGITSSNANDVGTNYEKIMGVKEASDLKVLFCVGGTEFPSHSWSAMAASADSRATFITSVQTMSTTYGFDGVELHWDTPGSAAKTIWLGDKTSGFTSVSDSGGSDADLVNLVALVSEMRATLGDSFIITMSVTRSSDSWAAQMASLDSFVDVFYVHAYNYNVSANANRMESAVTAPAQPVRNSEYGSSVTSTLADYVSTGVTASKLVLVVAAHGQSYHLPDALRDGWAKFGLATTVTGSCGGPYSSSHGAYPSAVTGRCGEITNIEVMVGLADASSAVPDPTLDDATGSNIAFFPKTQTWISFTGRTAMQGLAAAMQAQGGGGLALYTLDMDIMEAAPSYNMSVEMCFALYGESDTRCVLPETTQPPTTDDCSSGITGIFCLSDQSGFIFCPQGIQEYCPSGTVCKPLGEANVMCDWPDYDWNSVEAKHTEE